MIDSPGLQQLLQDLGIALSLPPGINLAPTEPVSLVRQLEQGNTMDSARWWLTPSWAKEISQTYSMFNARSETLHKSPAFRGPFKRQRGLVPISSFIEWRPQEGVKQPWLITNEQQALAVAALWDVWEGGESPLLSCTLVTTAAAQSFMPWHKRMPVILAPEEWDAWMDCGHPIAPDDAIFRSELKTNLLLTPLALSVNNARNKDPSVIVPQGEVIELAS